MRKNHYVLNTAVVALLLSLVSTSGWAYFQCYKPYRPTCVDYSFSQSETQSCRNEVNIYIQQMKNYQQCISDELDKQVEEKDKEIKKLHEEAQLKVLESSEEANQVIKNFNCHLGDKKDC